MPQVTRSSSAAASLSAPSVRPGLDSTVATLPGRGTAPASATPARRWRLIDALRGFALCGILFANAPFLLGIGEGLSPDDFAGQLSSSTGSGLLGVLVEQRFVPIFCFLFGLSAQLIVLSARRRGTSPWLPLALRLVALLGIGLLHALVFPGDVLREYAVAGLALLPVVLLAPRWLTAALGAVLTIVAFAVLGGGVVTVPGLLLLGSAAASYGLPAVLERPGRSVVAVFVTALLASVAGTVAQAAGGPEAAFGAVGASTGLVVAVTYASGLALLWRTRARALLAAAFEPLGRTALTNYLAASVVLTLVALASSGLGWSTMTTYLPMVVASAALLVVQSLLSRLWLRHFSYGPVEWAWRSVTWRRLAPMRGGVL
ncbi:DUF418 domain-containing protein [uncultured Frigoribacterium sp.]|uniref:DUF418 domain-containing protein n=1 Tax=uncultured Frigoribacterium sp. TaxID=335377 RepID=UPI0028D878D2|nr:DUF418 domain-containing protein [uncultured Frigoribacterium sp.]